ncbi:MAG TPA: AAA family ATPase [Bryobacteraceae bacterium]
MPDDIEVFARQFESSIPEGAHQNAGHFWIRAPLLGQPKGQPAFYSVQLNPTALRQWLLDPQSGHNALRQQLGPLFVSRLDGPTRIELTEPKISGDLQERPQNHLWALLQDDNARAQVRTMTHDAFGLHFTLDATGIKTFRIRLSATAPHDASEEQSFDKRARDFQARATPIEDFSDGVRAFLGLISAIVSLPSRTMLIDEPEAFLHPPLARRLGANLSRIATERKLSLITATHSSDFLMGCMEAAPNVSVVRLTYENGVTTARALSSEDLQSMTLDPLLRSTGVFRALFHRAVLVTEADPDRAFYDEMNRRLIRDNRGIADGLFINAQNKQTIRRIVGPLRRLGIPAAAIVDLDIVKQQQDVEMLLTACQIPPNELISLEAERIQIADAFFSMPLLPDGRQPIKRLGVAALSEPDRARAFGFIQSLRKYGVFIVEAGELERWLPQLGVDGQKKDWIVDVFSAIGQDESDSDYLHAGTGDVWAFLDLIADWVNDPNRRGTL